MWAHFSCAWSPFFVHGPLEAKYEVKPYRLRIYTCMLGRWFNDCNDVYFSYYSSRT